MVEKGTNEPQVAKESKKDSKLCKVLKANFFFPNGTTPVTDQVFDPCEIKMSVARYHSLIAGRYITPAGQEVETKLLKMWEKK